MTGYASATPVSSFATIDEFIHLSLACLLPFLPSVVVKMNSPFKLEKKKKSCPRKKTTCLYNTTEAYLYHLKGEVWGHPPVPPQWHFLTWHSVTFPVKYCWYSCRGIKSMSKRDTSIKALSLPLYLPLSSPPLCLLIPSSSHCNTGLHALPTKCGWLASPGIRRCFFNPNGLPKILWPIIHWRQTQSVRPGKSLWCYFGEKLLRLSCSNMSRKQTCRGDNMASTSVLHT